MNLTRIPSNFLLQGFQNLLYYRQTDRQTDTTEITYNAALQVVKNDYIYKNGNR